MHLLNTSNVSLASRNLTSNKSPAPFTNVKSKGEKEVRAAVPFRSNEVDEPGNNSAEVNALQTTEQRRAAEDLLVEKVLSGGIRLQLKVLEKVLPSLANVITLENLLREMQIILNISELTEPSPGQAYSKLEKIPNSEELIKKAELVEESNKNTESSRNLMQEKVNYLAQAVSEPQSRLADLFEVLTLLTVFCKNIFVRLQILVERKPITVKVFEDVASIIKQLISWEISLPKHLIKKYKCAKLFYEFSTGFCVDYFLSFFTKTESDYDYIFHSHTVDHLKELASWFELYIQLLVKLGTSVFNLDGKISPDDYKQLYRGFLSEHDEMVKSMFLGFKFSDPPCKNDDFALKMISIVYSFVKDVGSELSVMWLPKLDAKSQ